MTFAGHASMWPKAVAWALAGVFSLLGSATLATAQPPTRIAAASDMRFALEDLRERFTRETGSPLTIVFGSSGTLTRQIRDGAPFELFLSADESFVTLLHDAGLTLGDGQLYAVGRLALFAPTGSPLVPSSGLEGVRTLISSGRMTRFAIANPEVAPYGRAAEAALRANGLWDDLRPFLVIGDNVAQAAQFATTGNAVGGLIAHSLALAPAMKSLGSFSLIAEADHPPLRQRMVLLEQAGPVARQFYAYLQTPDARALLERYGFALPR